ASPLRPFTLKEELLFIEGLAEKEFAEFKDFITVYGNGSVNINTAPEQVFVALGMDENLAQGIVGFRNGNDGKQGTEDDQVFESSAEIVDKLRSALSFSGDEEAALVALISQNLLTVSSKNLLLEVQTQILNKAAIRYLITMEADKGKIKQWKEY
ncbi:MAG: type II secretion system protein GspK, partial [Candidatus Omnitrophica bacterium]|nr:type II secretion system protein GspK [Candidatus Omnitrophota bacterium]